MARTKERRKIVHQPSTHEIFLCLSNMQGYSKILLGQNSQKQYVDFLRWILDKKFYAERTDKITVKKIAIDFKSDAVKVTRWLKEIYEAILDLNYERPDLFQGVGIKACLYFKNYDNNCSFYTSLPAVPREFESFRSPFVKGKLGIDWFWVKNVEHEISEDDIMISLWLHAGAPNKYREFSLDEAVFKGEIGQFEVYDKYPFEIDDQLKKLKY